MAEQLPAKRCFGMGAFTRGRTGWMLAVVVVVCRSPLAGGLSLAHAPHVQSSRRAGQPVVWVHVHKNAGSLICDGAKQNGERLPYGAKNFNCNMPGSDGYMEFGMPVASCEERRTGLNADATWFAVEREFDDAYFCPGFALATLLRDPIQRMISNINFEYEWSHEKAPTKTQLLADLRGAVEEGTRVSTPHPQPWVFLDNYQVRVLGGALHVPAGEVREKHVRRAQERLAKFLFVGRVEDLRDPANRDELAHVLGWDSLPRESNTGDGWGRPFAFNAEETQYLTDLNRWDSMLYRSVDPESWSVTQEAVRHSLRR